MSFSENVKPPKLKKKIFWQYLWIKFGRFFMWPILSMCNKLFLWIFHTYQWWHYKLEAIVHDFSERTWVRLSFCTFLCSFSIPKFYVLQLFHWGMLLQAAPILLIPDFPVRSPELWWRIIFILFNFFFWILLSRIWKKKKECSLSKKNYLEKWYFIEMVPQFPSDS